MKGGLKKRKLRRKDLYYGCRVGSLSFLYMINYRILIPTKYRREVVYQCDCGNVSKVSDTHWGKIKNCRLCWQFVDRNAKTNDKLYKTWSHMIDRCVNHKNAAFHNYGGRGIKVCDRWFDFKTWRSDIGDRPDGFELDRIDVNGNYEPNNCRWATPLQQQNNRRNNVYLEIGGERMTVTNACKKMNVSFGYIRRRMKIGKSGDEIFAEYSMVL